MPSYVPVGPESVACACSVHFCPDSLQLVNHGVDQCEKCIASRMWMPRDHVGRVLGELVSVSKSSPTADLAVRQKRQAAEIALASRVVEVSEHIFKVEPKVGRWRSCHVAVQHNSEWVVLHRVPVPMRGLSSFAEDRTHKVRGGTCQ